MPDKSHKDITLAAKKTAEKPNPVLKTFSRDDLLQANGEIIKLLRARIKGKRFRVQEGDLVKIQYLKTLIYSLRCMNEILKYKQLDELDKKLKTLEEVYNTRSVIENVQARSLAEDKGYNSYLERPEPGNISEY